MTLRSKYSSDAGKLLHRAETSQFGSWSHLFFVVKSVFNRPYCQFIIWFMIWGRLSLNESYITAKVIPVQLSSSDLSLHVGKPSQRLVSAKHIILSAHFVSLSEHGFAFKYKHQRIRRFLHFNIGRFDLVNYLYILIVLCAI